MRVWQRTARLSSGGRAVFLFSRRPIHFPWMASIAESFRSTCGFERGAPECSTQLLPEGTPQVGQRTEHTCLGVRSFFFTLERYSKTRGKNCPIWNNLR